MKIFNKVSVIVYVVALILGLAGPTTPALAATTPTPGAEALFGILADTFTRNIAVTTITGDVGYTTLSGSGSHTVTGTDFGSGAPYATAGTDQAIALANVNAQVIASCTVIAGTLNSVVIGANPPGTFPPGCYTSVGAMTITLGTTVNLDLTAPGGVGSTWLFKPGAALTTGADSFVTLANGASACNVFWAPVGATTLGAFTTGGIPPVVPTFVGTIFRGDAGGLSITLGHFARLLGRALAFGSTVTTDTNVITVPTCAPIPAPAAVGLRTGTINVVKTVINDNAGTRTIADFPLFVNGTLVSSGVTNTFPAPASVYTVTESTNPNYTRIFSGDCDINGQMNLSPGDNKFCIVTNNDIGVPGLPNTGIVPPLIDVVKVPNPLALPNGPGPVTYTYTARNIGTVPMTSVTMVGDSCSPITLVSGDINADATLDLNETWTYRCTTTLSATHTNTVVATGWANGISAVDIATATVVVGVPGLPNTGLVPPLIHVTKVPSRLTLPGAGTVTYTERVTNPGAVAIRNVSLTDDKCSPLNYISGDMNGDSMLDTNEAWTYTCTANLIQTTTNTAIAIGTANDLITTDFAIATVIVSVPGLPATGIDSGTKTGALWSIIMLTGIFVALLSFYLARKKLTI